LGERREGGDGPVDVRLLDLRAEAFTPAQQGVAAQSDDDAHDSILQSGDERGVLMVFSRFVAWSKPREASEEKILSVASYPSRP
jgi:hypothetical protein